MTNTAWMSGNVFKSVYESSDRVCGWRSNENENVQNETRRKAHNMLISIPSMNSQIVCRTCRRVPMSGNCCGWFAVNVCFSSDWHFSKIAKSNEWILTFYELSSQEIGFSCLWRSNKNRRNFYYYLEIFFATANDLTTF